MPILTGVVTELTDHVFYPVARQLSHRLLQIFGLADFIGTNVYVNSDFTSTNYTRDEKRDAIVSHDAFRVEFKPMLNPSSQKWDFYTFKHTTAYGINRRMLEENQPIYDDPLNRVRIIEMRTPVSIQMDCTFEIESADRAYMLPQMIFNRYETGSIIEFNDLFFDYPVPKAIVNILRQIYKQDTNFGYGTGVTFEQYIKRCTQGLWTCTINRDIKHEMEFTIPIRNLKSLGALEFSGDGPEPERDNAATGFYRIPFTYTAQFNLITMCIMQYPVAIANTALPVSCFVTENTSRHNTLDEYQHYRAEHNYENIYHYYPHGCVTVPSYDDWFVPYYGADKRSPWGNSHTPIAILTVLLDNTDDLTTDIDLSEPVDESFRFEPYILDILRQEGASATDPRALINVHLFRDNICLKANEDFTFDANLHLKFTGVNTYSHYHLVVSIINNSLKLHPSYYYLLVQHFNSINKQLREFVARILVDGVWSSKQYSSKRFPKPWFISRDGYLLDANRELIVKLSESEFSYQGNLDDPATNAYLAHPTKLQGYNTGAENANLTKSRVFSNTIKTRKS